MSLEKIAGQNILITGGAGFVGSHLVERLCQDNNIVVIDNLCYGSVNNIRDFEHVLIKEDISTADLTSIMLDNKIGLVFHMASHHLDDSLREPMVDFQTSALGGIRMLEAARNSDIKRFVYTSTGSVYGEPKIGNHDEEHQILPMVPYGASKASTDHYCRIYYDLYGLKTVRLRYYNIYGPRRTAGAIPKFLLTGLNGGTIYIEGGDQVRTPTYVTDTVEATIRAGYVDEAVGKVFNIASSEAISIMDMAKLAVRMCDAQDQVSFEETVYRPGEIMQLRPNAKLAEDILGWKASVSIEDGFSKLIEYLRNNHQ